MKELRHKVKDAPSSIKISDYLKSRLEFSGALITKVKFGGVYLNGEPVTMRATVKNGDEIKVIFPTERNEFISPYEMPLDVIYEDEYIIAINKPKNMPTHPSRGNSLPTLANAMAAYFKRNFIFRAVIRLDRDTSGIVLMAKDQRSASILSSSMKKGEFVKKYTAILSGTPTEKRARIDAPIEREREGSLKRVVRPDGKRAITEYEIIKELPDGNSVAEITLYTGRTHQIRVHMAYVGHPLKSDFLYGKDEGKPYSLHSSYLSFPHPITKEIVEIVSTPPFI